MKRIIKTLIIASVAQMATAQVTVDTDPTDFGLWADASIEKSIGKKWDLGAEIGLRTQDAFSSLNRWSVGVSADFSPLKILSLGIGYSLIDSHYEPSYTSKGNIVDEYWRIKNRFYFGAKVKGKWSFLRPSLRLRYQLTHKSEVNIKKYDSDGITRKTNKVKATNNESMLRTKIAFGFKTETRLTPQISYELYNKLSDSFSLDKSRLTIGTDIKLNKHNELGVGYIRTIYKSGDDDDMHNALNISYKIKF